MAFNLDDVLGGLNVPKAGTGPELQIIDISALRADEKNFYAVTEESVAELAANIELVGLQQPLNVRPDPEHDGTYIVISGHRRLAALQLLVSEGKDFAAVPCMTVENGSEALNELRLIYGNANTRQLSNWELSRQAERVQELFYQLKEEGMEFPGRMRDHVAQACQVSKSKLSRLKVINEQLEVFVELWQNDKLSEAVAYELAQCPQELQWRIRDIKIKPEKLNAEKLRRVREAWDKGARWNMEIMCTPTGKTCGHGDAALRRDLKADSWQGLCKGEKCCLLCEYGAECRNGYGACEAMCRIAADKRKARKPEAEREAAEYKEKCKAKAHEELQARLAPYVKAAEAAGLAEDVRFAFSYDRATVGELKAWLQYPESVRVPWWFRKPEATDLAKFADACGCSVDFLLGRTEVMAMACPALPRNEPKWQTGEPENDGYYWCRLDFHDGLEPWTDEMRYRNGQWRNLPDDVKVIGWWPLPEE